MDNSKTYPRDVFLYLSSIAALVAVAVSFGILIYNYIDLTYPDVLDGYYSSKTAAFNSVRNAMAVLIVIMPVFVWISWFLSGDIKRHPQKRDLKIRRWLLYLTLFIASGVIVGDLIALLNSFLNGELTTRFALKVFAVLFIAVSVLFHYLSELKDNPFLWINLFDKILVFIIAVGVIGGFWIAGSPAYQRSVRLDERRVSDLSSIQYRIIDYWQRKQELPKDLVQLEDSISGFTVPVDPETNRGYVYTIMGEMSFELCAIFDTSAEIDGSREAIPYTVLGITAAGGNWSHDTGKVCFERTIDPDYYPPIEEGAVIKPR